MSRSSNTDGATSASTSASPDITGQQLLKNLNLTYKLPEVLSVDQLQELQVSIFKLIEERIRVDTSTWNSQHQNMMAKQSELSELRNTYQTISKTLQNLADKNEQELQSRDQ